MSSNEQPRSRTDKVSKESISEQAPRNQPDPSERKFIRAGRIGLAGSTQPMAVKNTGCFIFFLFIGLSACEVLDKEEEVPSYIHIDKINVSTDYSTEGTNSHNISDAWVFVDDQSLGAYELPATLPVLAEGNHEIKIRAGIKNNGIAATRLQYPFYDYYKTTFPLSREKILNISPVVNYFSYTTFAWKEDFEGAAFSIIDTSGTDTVMKFSLSDVFEGNKCGIVTLDANTSYYEGKSGNSFSLPKAGAPIYLELNYKCNNEFSVGAYSASVVEKQTALVINPSESWNKIYVELTSIISQPTNSNPFRIFISMQKGSDVTNPYLMVDNIKLVH